MVYFGSIYDSFLAFMIQFAELCRYLLLWGWATKERGRNNFPNYTS